MTVSFTVGIDRGSRPRDEANLHLKPVGIALVAQGVSIKNVIKGTYTLVCETDQATFETLFSVILTSKSQFIPNLNGPGTNITNWEASGLLVIPGDFLKLGVDRAAINRKVALTD